MQNESFSSWPPSGGQRVYVVLSFALLLAAFAAIVQKAWTLSFTMDEAFTYNTWCAGPFSAFFTVSSYNNHPLNTLLCRVSAGVFGGGEFSLRLPSVLSGLLYLLVVQRIAVLLFGNSLWMLLLVGVNALNPFVLDHFSTARGYGMGLALWMLGAYYVARWMRQQDSRKLLLRAGAALGLASAAYLTEVFAATALCAVLILVYLADRFIEGGWKLAGRFAWSTALPFAGVGLAVAALILYAPLRLAKLEGIDGVPKFKWGPKELFDAVLFYQPEPSTLQRLVWNPLHKWPWAILLMLWGALLIAAVVVALRMARVRRLQAPTTRDRDVIVFGGALLITFLLLYIEPRLLHHAFFTERRLLFTLPVIFLACTILLRWLSEYGKWGGRASVAGALVLTLLAGHMAAQYTPQSFYGWKSDAGAKSIVGVLHRLRPDSEPVAPLRVAAPDSLSHALNYYRTLYGTTWFAPITLDGTNCLYDYYVLPAAQLPTLRRYEPRVLYRDPVADTVLAEPGPVFRARLAALREAGLTGSIGCQVDLMSESSWAAAGSPGVNSHLLSGIMEDSEAGHQRWTFERPAYVFHVKGRRNLKVRFHVRVHPITYAATGPVQLTVWVNGKRLPEEALNAPEDRIFERNVPPEWIREDGVTLVETTQNKYYIAPEDGQKLGYLFIACGFVE